MLRSHGARWTYFQWPRRASRVPQAPQQEEIDTKLGQLRRLCWHPLLWGQGDRATGSIYSPCASSAWGELCLERARLGP